MQQPSPSKTPAPVDAGAALEGLAERLRELRDALLTGLVERDVAVRLALIATLAGEHLLLVGPPGTAKSLVARRLHLAFDGAAYFERLLTRFTVPEELFGPLSIKGLEEDRYERITASYLPTASIAFLDEIFKANSAILNALLTLLNEREFDNGARRTKTPLIAVVGASNELNEGEELAALFDRFLLRLHVGPVSKGAFPALLGLRGEATPTVHPRLRLTATMLAEVQELTSVVEIPEDVVALLCDLRDWCLAEGIQASDRRWRKVVKLLQVAALTNGRSKVSIWDAWLLQHCLWDKPEDREKIQGWYTERVGVSAAMDPSRLTRVVTIWEGQLKRDQDSRSQMYDDQNRPLFAGTDGEPSPETTRNMQAKKGDAGLFLAPAQTLDPRRGWNPIQDRTNNGRGYTADELQQLNIGGESEFRYWSERGNYLSDSNHWLTVDEKSPPMMEPTRHKQIYVADCLQQIDALKADVVLYQRQLAEHTQTMERDIRSHLWVTEDFVEPAVKTLQQTAREVERLVDRIGQVRKGFELLPREQSRAEKVGSQEGAGKKGSGGR